MVNRIAEQQQMGICRANVTYQSYAAALNKKASTAHAYTTTITARSSQTMVPVEKVEQMKKDAVQTALDAVTAALVIKPDLINITNLTVDQSVLKICTALEFITGVKPDATKIAAGIARSNSIGSNYQGVTTSEK